MSSPRLGRVQLKIVQVLWEKGRANAREITDAMNVQEPIAHSTVQTLLRQLEAKGAVDHEVDDRTFVFRPLVECDAVQRKATREFIENIFVGSPGGLVSYLLRHERIPQRELAEIRRLVDKPTKRAGTKTRSAKRKEK